MSDLALTFPPAFSPAEAPRLAAIVRETPELVAAREALLDAAMGPGRRRKSSEAIRRGRLPAEGLAFAGLAADGTLLATLRLWDIEAGRRGERGVASLLLGPLAVDPALKGAGIGSAMMRHALAAAEALGHGSVLLVGDPGYYERFGFSAAPTGGLRMPGPFEPHRFLAREFVPGSLTGAVGIVRPSGRRQASLPETGRHDLAA